MKRFLLLMVSMALFVAVSCDDNNPDNPGNIDSAMLIKSVEQMPMMSHGDGPLVPHIRMGKEFTYDESKRIAKIVHTSESPQFDDKGNVTGWYNGGGNSESTFVYDDAAKTVTIESMELIPGTFKVDNGRLTEQVLDAPAKQTFTYDDSGQMTSYTGGGKSYPFTWTEGNITGRSGSEVSYSFKYSSDLNPFQIGPDPTFGQAHPFFELGLLGKHNKNLLSSYTMNNNGNTSTSTFKYEKDSKGRITQIDEVIDGGTTIRTEIHYVED